jgi:cell envelope opacity-associated protein A
MKYYCNKCFKTIDYKFSKPEYCSNCGSKISVSSASFKKTDVEPAAPHKIDKPKTPISLLSKRFSARRSDQTEETDSEDYVFEGEIPDIKPGAGVKVEMPAQNKSVTFAQVFENPSSPESKDFVFKNENKQSESKILEQFKKESSNSREFFEVN